MTELFRKVNGNYEPVNTWDDYRKLSPGAHMVIVGPGTTSYIYNIDPANAAVAATIKTLTDQICNKFVENNWPFSNSSPTPEQQDAWRKLIKSFGGAAQMKSAFEQAMDFTSLVEELVKEDLNNPTIKAAYERYQSVVDFVRLGEKCENK